MMMSNIEFGLDYCKNLIDDALKSIFERYIKRYQNGTSLTEGMTYAVEDGGKRLRPVLLLCCYKEATGVIPTSDTKDVLHLAVALELIHSYSLVHDDMPCMDNDDVRRGKPSTHKAYGEAMALLIGDSLLNCAMEIALKGARYSDNHNAYFFAVSQLFEYSGIGGMAGGQALDLALNEGSDYVELMEAYKGKTCALFMAAAAAGSALSGAVSTEMLSFANALGYAFQLQDDLLDLTADSQNRKDANVQSAQPTVPSRLGAEFTQTTLEHFLDTALYRARKISPDNVLLRFVELIKGRKF